MVFYRIQCVPTFSYVELKNVLQRQPGPEIGEQVSLYQAALRTKTKQMKRRAGELNMYESQSVEYRFEIERLATELQDTKKKWFAMKKADQNRRNKEAKEKNEQNMANKVPNVDSRGPRFTGGGFNLDQGASVLKTM